MEKLNRAERRKNKFGGGRATEHGGWPMIEPNPIFGEGDRAGGPAAASKQTSVTPPSDSVPHETEAPPEDPAKG
jgi:hypothetical protein